MRYATHIAAGLSLAAVTGSGQMAPVGAPPGDAGGDVMAQPHVLIEGDTLHIGFYREGKAPYPEDVIPAALLRAVAQHLKVDLRTQGIFWGDYELWLSGELARETGLPCRVWGWDDNLRRRILWNLRDRRLPVLLLNCGPWPDWYLLTRMEDYWMISGYGGSSGEGYRPNEPLDDERNPLRHIELFDWMKGRQTWTINLTARRATPRPPLTELYRRAIAWGATSLPRQTMKVLGADGREIVSPKPYEDWAAMLVTDELFPANQPEGSSSAGSPCRATRWNWPSGASTAPTSSTWPRAVWNGRN
jgi:hypothetical protein